MHCTQTPRFSSVSVSLSQKNLMLEINSSTFSGICGRDEGVGKRRALLLIYGNLASVDVDLPGPIGTEIGNNTDYKSKTLETGLW